MDCEICGKEGNLTLVSMRNAKMWVCKNCRGYGTDVPKQFTPIKTAAKSVALEDEDYFDFVENYTRILRNARDNLNLTYEKLGGQINESASLIKKIEAGKIKPTEKQTKKLERFFNIKIYKKVEE